MTVYIVLRDSRYSSARIKGVYSTLKAANKSKNNEPSYDRHNFFIYRRKVKGV